MALPLKNKYSETITKEFSNILTKSKRHPLKKESDRGAEFYNSIFQNFLKAKNAHHYSRFADKGPSIAERVIRTIRSLLKKPVFLKGNADRWYYSYKLYITLKSFNTLNLAMESTIYPRDILKIYYYLQNYT